MIVRKGSCTVLLLIVFFAGMFGCTRIAQADEAIRSAAAASQNTDRPATVLLVTSNKLAKAWRPFADWKTRAGKHTKIVTVDQIGQHYQGADIQQKIRACVVQHIAKHGTRWVILGGDSQPGDAGHVPDRDTLHASYGYDDIPTDIYYLSKKSWDANGDGVYGDWENDRDEIAYTHAQASIGRIPLRTVDEVAAYTEKVIGYESRYPNKAFASQMIYTCPVRGAYPKLTRSWQSISGDWKSGRGRQFFASKTPWDADDPGDHDLSTANWIAMINAHTCGKMHMHGHGLLPLWVLEGSQMVDRKSVAQLKNRDAYLLMTTVSCFTGHYDSQQDPSIAESMLRQARAGAVAVIAPSREGVPVFHNPRTDFRLMITEGKMDGTTELLTRFWQHGLRENLTTGEAFSAARAELAKDARKTAGYHWCLCELNLLGDPTLDMRSRDPVTPKVEHPKKVGTGRQSLSISTSAPGATVCVWKGDEVYEVTTADKNGLAVATIVPATAGDLLVTVSGPNLNTFTATIAVGPF